MTLYDGSVEQMVSQDVKLRGYVPIIEDVTKDILRALMYLANKGLILRDVKPDSILVESILIERPQNSAKQTKKFVLADFGLLPSSFAQDCD